MLSVVLLILIVSWFGGYGPFLAFRVPLFELMGQTITLWDILIFLVIIWVIDLLPGFLRQVAGVALILWLLSLFGLLAIPMLPNLIVLALIIGIGLQLLSKK